MGAIPWSYFVPYTADFQAALEQLREREFQAERYFPLNSQVFWQSNNERPSTIDAARELAGADGTRSILDIDAVGDTPGYGVAKRLSDQEMHRYFGSTQPTHEAIREAAFWDDIERGQAICCAVYEAGAAEELFFAGYSYD